MLERKTEIGKNRKKELKSQLAVEIFDEKHYMY
jgi:predicted HTH domain antitoxin